MVIQDEPYLLDNRLFKILDVVTLVSRSRFVVITMRKRKGHREGK